MRATASYEAPQSRRSPRCSPETARAFRNSVIASEAGVQLFTTIAGTHAPCPVSARPCWHCSYGALRGQPSCLDRNKSWRLLWERQLPPGSHLTQCPGRRGVQRQLLQIRTANEKSSQPPGSTSAVLDRSPHPDSRGDLARVLPLRDPHRAVHPVVGVPHPRGRDFRFRRLSRLRLAGPRYRTRARRDALDDHPWQATCTVRVPGNGRHTAFRRLRGGQLVRAVR